MAYQVIVVGGGPAGVTAALRARELGAEVALVERGRMGGTCTNDGCVPTRVLAKAARLIRDAEQFDEYGLTFGGPPQLDFSRLMARTQSIVYQIHEKKQLIAQLRAAGVTVYAEAGAARFLDPHTLELGDGTRLEGRSFVLCAGGHARRLDFPGEELALTHSDVWSLRALPRRVAIVGGAATGCQLATVFEAFGAQVTLMEVAPRLLRVEDEAVAEIIQENFTARGVRLILGIGGIERIERAETPEAGLRLHYKWGEGVEVVEADAIVLSTGWLGNVDSLNLGAAGVEALRNYVRVDDTLRTTAPHIYAAGDITGRMMLVQTAGSQANAAVENLLLGGGQDFKHQLVPHGGFTDPEYGSVGLTEEAARRDGLDVLSATVPYAQMDRAVIDGRTAGFCKLVVAAETHRILGAHVVGEQALEVVHLVAAGMAADMLVEQIADLEIAYPTYTAVVGLAARKLVDALGVRPVAPAWRALGHAPAAEWERSSSL